MLDPDGDILDYLLQTDRASPNQCWAGYHTQMYEFDLKGRRVRIIGRAVGASFAVLLAEQLFVSGCKLLISIISAGMIKQLPNRVKFILIEEALRAKGTSYHYLSPEEPATLNSEISNKLQPLLSHCDPAITGGKSWTTGAPFRESQEAIDAAKRQGVVAVEMEAAVLYAFAEVRKKKIVCFAHLTNTMAQQEKDFEKGLQKGRIASLKVISKTISNLNVTE